MKIPVDKLTSAFKMGASVKKDSDTPVRVSVYLDSTGVSLFGRDGARCLCAADDFGHCAC